MTALASRAPRGDGRSADDPALADVWRALAEVADPEMPGLSVVDLGMVGSIDRWPDRLRVEILPTFVGCPAVELIRAAVGERLAGLSPEVEVVVSFVEPWTSDRITPVGREKLERSGFAPPEAAAGAGIDGPPQLIQLAAAPACPYCGSRRTRLESAFGPTPCRSIAYCAACRQPFEAFKSV